MIDLLKNIENNYTTISIYLTTGRPGSMIKIIKPTGEEIIIETMKKLEREYSFSTHLIRKYRDTNINILEKDLKKENIILLDCIIESIKE